MEERAGGVLSPEPAERDRPRMDPPNVLWFFGAIATSFAVDLVVSTIPDSQSSLWRFLAAVGFFLASVLAAWVLLKIWWIPGGLAAVVAVATFPSVAVAFLQLIDVWPDSSFDSFSDFSGYQLGVALATAAAGLVAFALTRFSFILAVVITAILVAAQLLVPAYESAPSGEDRTTMALAVGASVVIVGVFLDAFGRRRDAFWFHALGWLSVAAGLVFYTVDPGGDPDRGWIPMLVVGVLMLIVAGPTRRATWAVYGVLGYYAPVVHYMVEGLDEDRWPFALILLALSLSIFAAGMLLHRYGGSWAGRFVRRPPPSGTGPI